MAYELEKQLLRNIGRRLVAALPGAMRDGVVLQGVAIPACRELRLPDLQVDGPEAVGALCPGTSQSSGNIHIGLHELALRGLDAVSAFGDIAFQGNDMDVPLLYSRLALGGRWLARQRYHRRDDPRDSGETAVRGTFDMALRDVQITLSFRIDDDFDTVIDVLLALSDRNGRWHEQPQLSPADDIKYAEGTSKGHRSALEKRMSFFLRREASAQMVRDKAREALEHLPIRNDIRDLANRALAG